MFVFPFYKFSFKDKNLKVINKVVLKLGKNDQQLTGGSFIANSDKTKVSSPSCV